AMWRYHGNQLSLRRDESRLGSMKAAGERTLRGICERQPRQLTRNDCEALLLPYKILMARSAIGRVYRWFEAAIRLWWIVFDRPAATWRGLRRAKFRFGDQPPDTAGTDPAGGKIQGGGLGWEKGGGLKKCLTNGKCRLLNKAAHTGWDLFKTSRPRNFKPACLIKEPQAAFQFDEECMSGGQDVDRNRELTREGIATISRKPKALLSKAIHHFHAKRAIGD